MKIISTAVAALALTTVMSVGPAQQAKADGGAIAIGVGVYLLADALIGRECGSEEWPLNIIRKVGDELHGRPACHRGHHDRHHRHHGHHGHHGHDGHHGHHDKYK
jgi:hypothetical protein